MAKLLFPKKTLLVKMETVYNTDPVPDGANAFKVRNLRISPYEGDRIKTEEERDTLGNEPESNVAPFVRIRGEVILRGSGSLGVAPGFASLLRICGFAETINIGVDVQYNLVSGGFESATLYFINDGQLHRATGCRGTVRFEFNRGQWPLAVFEVIGWYHSPQAAGVITPAPANFGTPLPVKEGTTALTVDGHTPCCESLTADLKNDYPPRDVINCRDIPIVDRAPDGSLNIEAVDLATKNYFNLLESHQGTTLVPLQLIHGPPGNRITLDAPQVQLAQLGEVGESNGLSMYNFNLTYIPSAGDDEMSLTFD